MSSRMLIWLDINGRMAVGTNLLCSWVSVSRPTCHSLGCKWFCCCVLNLFETSSTCVSVYTVYVYNYVLQSALYKPVHRGT